MKKVLYVIVGIIVLYLVLALIAPAHIKIEKRATINKPADLVKKHVGDFKFFHDKWSPWTELDTAMKTTYTGNPGEVGHKYEWSGNNKVSTGSMEIVSIKGDSINQKLSFAGQGDSKCYYIAIDNKGSTDFIWGIEMDIPFLFRPVMLFTDMGMNGHFEKGVGNLKKAMEELKEEPVVHYDISEENWEAVTYIGKKETVAFDKIPEFFGKNFKGLFDDLGKSKLMPLSPPSALFTNYDQINKKAEVAAVAKVPQGTTIKGWETFSFPASKVLHIEYYGDYSKSVDAHFAIAEYMKEKGLNESAIVEEYVTDPMAEKDPSKWLTNIYYVLK